MKITLQICVVLALCLVSEAIAAVLPFPFPASVLAMVLLLLLLFFGVLKPAHLQQKADFLLQNMALFFVPSCVGVLQYTDVLLQNWLPLLAICLITTPLVFAVTAWSVKAAIALTQKKGAPHE